MEGFRVEGKAYCVCEELRAFAERHKGMKVAEFLKLRRLKKTVDNQIDEIINQVKKKGY